MQQALEQAWGSIMLCKYLTKKFHWGPGTGDKVDGHPLCHTLSMQAHSCQIFIIKYIHQWLPLNTHPSQCKPNMACPWCPNQDKTALHFLHCLQNPQKALILKQWLTTVFQKFLINKKLQQLILLGLQGDEMEEEGPLATHESPEYSRVIHSQCEVGWENLWYGCWSIYWNQQQHCYLEDCKQTLINKHATWISTSIQEIWAFAHKLWLAQCKWVNQEQSSTHQSYRQHQQLLSQMTALYNMWHELLLCDQHPFHIPLNKWKQQPTPEVEQWIHCHHPYIKHTLQLTHQHLTRQTQDICKFFTPMQQQSFHPRITDPQEQRIKRP